MTITHLYVSDVTGTIYSLSLRYIVADWDSGSFDVYLVSGQPPLIIATFVLHAMVFFDKSKPHKC